MVNFSNVVDESKQSILQKLAHPILESRTYLNILW